MSANRYGAGRLALTIGLSVLAIGLVVLTAAIWLYLLSREPDRVELKRVASPDGVYDAVLVRVGGTGGAGVGSEGNFELYVVEAGEEATGLPRSERLLITNSLSSSQYEVRWQDERTLEFDHYKAGEVLRFGCGPYPREVVRTDAGTWSTKMPDEVCAAGNASPETTQGSAIERTGYQASWWGLPRRGVA